MGATLACGGVNPVTEERVVPPAVARDVVSVMATCGVYDGSGRWMRAATGMEAQPDWIETNATVMGYVKHPLEQLLAWLDSLMLWLEEMLLKIWQHLINLGAIKG